MKLSSLLFCLLAWVCFPSQAAKAQSRTVSGTVKTAAGDPLQGVTVSLKGADTQAITDDAGSYRLEVPGGNQILVFSAVGFESQELPVPSSAVLHVVLVEAQSHLDEVVVVGYGTQSRRTITSAITRVGGEVLQDIPISTVGEGLKGKVAGARVYSSNNTPGADAVFRI